MKCLAIKKLEDDSSMLQAFLSGNEMEILLTYGREAEQVILQICANAL